MLYGVAACGDGLPPCARHGWNLTFVGGVMDIDDDYLLTLYRTGCIGYMTGRVFMGVARHLRGVLLQGELVVAMPLEDTRVFMGVARHLSSTLRGELVEAMPLGICDDGVVRGLGWCDAIV